MAAIVTDNSVLQVSPEGSHRYSLQAFENLNHVKCTQCFI
jgi:hypothetical protein